MIHFHFDNFFSVFSFFSSFFAVICCDAVEQSVEAIPVGFNSPRGGLRCLSRPECLWVFVLVSCLFSARAFSCVFFFFLRILSRVRSDAGDGGEAVVGFLQFLGLRAGSLGHGAEGERSADQGAAHVTRTQRRILTPVTLHDTRGVRRQTLPRPEAG